MTLPLGYRYAAIYAGIRKEAVEDLALIVPDKPSQAAALFTRNVVQAAPVRLARRHLAASHGTVAALVINAGNANCATRTGDKVALTSCKAAARLLKTKPRYVLPASTGVIGVELDSKRLTEPMEELVARLSPLSFEAVARAILTTDTRSKTASEELRLSKGTVRIAGMTKGAGMIHPNMATTLGFLMTDATLSARELQEMLVTANERSYGSLTIDGDTSTNDTVVLLANGAAGVRPDRRERKIFEEALAHVMESLARQIAADGEGATKLIVIRTAGFATGTDARQVARAIANSPLVKTAISGNDPNWGRILAAAGYSGVEFDPRKIDIEVQGVSVCKNGLASPFDESALKTKLAAQEVQLQLVQKGGGKGQSQFFTCDLTEDYIRINGSYRT